MFQPYVNNDSLDAQSDQHFDCLLPCLSRLSQSPLAELSGFTFTGHMKQKKSQ